MMPPPPAEAPRDGHSPHFAWTLVAGCIAGAVRLTLIYFQERVYHDTPSHLVGLMMVEAWWPSALAGTLLAAVAIGARRSLSPGWASRLVALLCAVVLMLMLGGVLLGPEVIAVGTQTDTGRLVWGALSVGSLGLIALSTALAERQGLAKPVAGIALLLVLSVPFIGHQVRPRLGSSFERERVVLHYPENFDQVEVLESLPGSKVRADVLTPSGDYRVDGADMPALIVPPPGRVRFQVPEGAGELWFQFTAGVDERVLGMFKDLGPRLAEFSVGFTLLVDDQEVWQDRAYLKLESVKKRGMAWLRPFESEGIAVEGGQWIEMSTALLGPEGNPVNARKAIKAGFGRCALIQRETIDRELADDEHPNLLVVLQDTQRADRMSTYGYERETSPNLTRIAERGVRFDDASASSSWTWPSTASVLTGLTPMEHGIVKGNACFLSDRFETLAEPWQEAGISTGGFSANPLIGSSRNFDQGFEIFDDGPVFRRSRPVVASALEWLKGVHERRFGMYLHLANPHAPLLPMPRDLAAMAPDVPQDLGNNDISDWQKRLLSGEGRDENMRLDLESVVSKAHQRGASDLYDACTLTGDRYFGKVIDALEDYGVLDHTLVLYTSDHGEELFDHGFATHGHTLYQELVRIPLVLSGPGVPRGQVVSRAVENRHSMVTLMRLAGLAPRSTDDLLGPGESHDPAQVLSTAEGWWNGHHRTPLFGLRKDNWVLHNAPRGGPWRGRPTTGGEWRLYDLERDPTEREDLAELEATRAEEMLEELKQRVAELSSRAPDRVFGGAGSTRAMLERVGYVEAGDE